MRRLGRLDKALLVVGVPLWVVCFGLHLGEWSRGRLAWIPLTASPGSGADAPPRISGFLPGADPGDLRTGDVLLRAGEQDLSGRGAFGFAAAVWSQTGPDHSLPIEVQRGAVRRESSLRLLPVGMGWRLPLMSLGFAVPAFLVLLRRPGTRVVRLFYGASLAYALHWTFFFGGPPVQTALWLCVWFGSALLMFPLAVQAILAFSDPERGGPTRIWSWALAVYAVTALAWVFGVPFSSEMGVRASSAVNALVPLLMLALLGQSYRRADALGRRQLRWVFYGFLVGAGPVGVGSLVTASVPDWWWIHEMLMSAVVLIPVCTVIAIARYKLFDVDRLFTATLSYSLLLTLLAGLVLGVVPGIASWLSRASGIDSGTTQALLSVLLAIGVVPGGRRVRDRLEHTFLAERRALEEGVEEVLRELAATSEPEKVLRLVGDRLDALLQPAVCVIYGVAGGGYAPIFQRGGCAPPVLAPESGLGALLSVRGGPVDVEEWRERGRDGGLEPSDRAVLDSLRAAVLVPVFAQHRLLAIVILGEKLSGDVYTGTDLSLLAAIAHAGSTALERYGEAELLRRTREMQESLRRFVPGAIAEEIERGRPLTEGPRQVSVLFVDIRGYTAFAESRQAGDVFAVINRYTELVSREVRAHGGSIVEFNGDGMMAVFGAPRALQAKERAAVQAGRSILASLAATSPNPDQPLEAGVGIATGEAFVGSIRAVDRSIWSAIGNPTNLAARLERLTREYGALMVIDEATWRGAGDFASGFLRREETRVRGRRDPMSLYLLARDESASGSE